MSSDKTYPTDAPRPALFEGVGLTESDGDHQNIAEMQARIVKLALYGERVFERTLITTTKFTPAQRELNLMAHGACLHGWALASMLGYLAERHPDIADDMAQMVESMAMDGGADWISEEVVKAAAEKLGDLGNVEPSTEHPDPRKGDTGE